MSRIPVKKASLAPPVLDGELPFDRLPTLVFERLATLLSRHGELLYQRLFGLRLSECRVLAVVFAQEPLSLRQACEELELDKGHASRLVAGLVAAGFVERRADAADQRSFYLLLTTEGRRLARRIRRAAVQRNRRWIDAFDSAAEADAFLAALDRQTRRARAMLDGERSRSGLAGAVRPGPSAGASDADSRTLLVVERGELEALRAGLERVLGSQPPAVADSEDPDAPAKPRSSTRKSSGVSRSRRSKG